MPVREVRQASPLAAGIVAASLALGVSATAHAEEPSATDAANESAPSEPAKISAYDAAKLCLIRVNDHDFAVCRGPYREEVATRDFYALVGREDLVSKDSNRKLARVLMLGGGLVMSVAGLVLLVVPTGSDGKHAPLTIPLALMAGGFTLGFVGARAFRGPAITPDEAEGLVELYNSRLPGAPPSTRHPQREARFLGIEAKF